jgi:predicted enzyme related to lactoylglutathione lyase
MPPMTAGEVRKFAVLADPQGAAFAIVEPRS